MKKLIAILIASLMVLPTMAMPNNGGNGKKSKETTQVSYVSISDENSQTYVELQPKTNYNLQITDIPTDILRARLKKQKGANSKNLKVNSRKVKIKNGTMDNKVKTGKGNEAFVGSVQFIPFVESASDDDTDDDMDDDMMDDSNDDSTPSARKARLVAGDSINIYVNVLTSTVCEVNAVPAPVCGQLTFLDENGETALTATKTYTSECEMTRAGATKLSDGECPVI